MTHSPDLLLPLALFFLGLYWPDILRALRRCRDRRAVARARRAASTPWRPRPRRRFFRRP